MIKSLQRKFIMITMISLLFILIFLIGTINILNLVQMNNKVDGVIGLLAQNEGEFPSPDKDKQPMKDDSDKTDPGDANSGGSSSANNISENNISEDNNAANNDLETNPEASNSVSSQGMEQGGGDNPDDNNPARFKPSLGFQINEETPYETRYFTVKVGEDGSAYEINTSHIKAVSSSKAREYASDIMGSNKVRGYEGHYKYLVVKEDNGYLIIFVDCQSQLQTAMFILLSSIGVALLTIILMFILVSIFSRRAIKPIIESMEKQKQFITNAGHEIKTPLAIISANADVLELTGGENEWISSIRNQTTRLDKLVKNLLMLSKLEEGNTDQVFREFDISKTVYESACPFETIAETQNKKLEMHIQSGLKLYGDEGGIQQLVSTLVDNAMKYSDDGGIVKVSLSSYKKGIKFEVYNTAEEIRREDLDKLFDRFYRVDASRSRETGGYGIGLSIAKSIALNHHGKISVRSDDLKSICFTVVFNYKSN